MSMLDWRYYPKIARIARMAGADVGRGSETLMTYSRGDLFRAARHLSGSKEGRPARALVVTGFYIPKAAQPAAETDGPLGALEVCMALRAIGGDAWLVSDECCAPVIRPSALGFLPDDHVLIAPNANPKGGFDAWLNGVIDLAKTEHIDTLVYIERVGPARDGSPHNMRGIDITEWTAPLSQLTLLGLHTIGVGDGGNEIGMGRVETTPSKGWSTTERTSPARCRPTSWWWPARRIGARTRLSVRCARWAATPSTRILNRRGRSACWT